MSGNPNNHIYSGVTQQDAGSDHALAHVLLRHHAAGQNHQQIQQGKDMITEAAVSFNC